MTARLRICGILLLFTMVGASGGAHDPGLSTLQLIGRDSWVEIVLQFAPTDIAALVPLREGDTRGVRRSDFEAHRADLDRWITQWLELSTGSKPLLFTPASTQFDEPGNNIIFRGAVARAPTGQWTIRLPVLAKTSPAHREYFVAGHGTPRIIAEFLLNARQPEITFDWDSAIAHPADEVYAPGGERVPVRLDQALAAGSVPLRSRILYLALPAAFGCLGWLMYKAHRSRATPAK